AVFIVKKSPSAGRREWASSLSSQSRVGELLSYSGRQMRVPVVKRRLPPVDRAAFPAPRQRVRQGGEAADEIRFVPAGWLVLLFVVASPRWRGGGFGKLGLAGLVWSLAPRPVKIVVGGLAAASVIVLVGALAAIALLVLQIT